MKIGHSIDGEGFWTGDILEESGITPDVVTICPDGFYKPKWNGTSWAEGMSQSEIDAIKNAPKPPDPDDELAKAIQAATTLEELKKALTGSNGKLAKVKGELK